MTTTTEILDMAGETWALLSTPGPSNAVPLTPGRPYPGGTASLTWRAAGVTHVLTLSPSGGDGEWGDEDPYGWDMDMTSGSPEDGFRTHALGWAETPMEAVAAMRAVIATTM